MTNARDEWAKRAADLEQVADAEYERALEEGKSLVHHWAVNANYNVYIADQANSRAKAFAAFQEAIHQFAPKSWRK